MIDFWQDPNPPAEVRAEMLSLVKASFAVGACTSLRYETSQEALMGSYTAYVNRVSEMGVTSPEAAELFLDLGEEFSESWQRDLDEYRALKVAAAPDDERVVVLLQRMSSYCIDAADRYPDAITADGDEPTTDAELVAWNNEPRNDPR